MLCFFFFFQAEDGIRDRSPSRGLGDVYKRQRYKNVKVLLLTFEENEEDILTRILSCIGNRTEILEYEDRGILQFEGLCIDKYKRNVVREENEIELTYTEFEILLLLAQNAGVVFSKEQIYDTVWKEPYFGDYNIVMSHIRNIREKIEDNPSKPIYIQTVWGVGYRFNKNLVK